MGYQALAYVIVEQAVYEYKLRKSLGVSVVGLTAFFKSDWCNTLLADFPMTGEDILTQLNSTPITIS